MSVKGPNYYNSNNFDEIGRRFKKIPDNSLQKTLILYGNTFLSEKTLIRLGLGKYQVQQLLGFIGTLINQISGGKLSEKFFNYIDKFIASEVKSTDKKNTGDTDEMIIVRDAQKTHYACGLVKYIYELNEMRQIVSGESKISKENFKDSTKQNWTRSSLSFTGTHTHGVNSDAVLQKTNPRILAAVADGVSIPSLCPENPRDFYVNQYSSATGSKGVIEGLENFNPSVQISSETQENQDELKLRIQDDSIFFFNDLLQLYNQESNSNIINSQQESLAKPKNLNDLINLFKTNTQLGDCLKQKYGVDNLKALNDKTVTQHLALAEAVLQSQQNLKKVFDERHPSIKLSAGTTLSFAMDLGDQIGFVNIGDSPIFVFNKQRQLINSPRINSSHKVRNPIAVKRTSKDNLTEIEKTELSDSDICIVDKKDIGSFLIMSDGAIAKGTNAESFSSEVIKDPETCLPRILEKLMKNTNSLDDTSIQLVEKID
jgi:serine/threonine protein phosphatase PrpC